MSAEKAVGCGAPSRPPEDWDVRLDKLLQENNDRQGALMSSLKGMLKLH